MKKVVSILLIVSLAISTLVVMPTNAYAMSTPSGIAISSEGEFASMTAEGQYYLNANITISATYIAEFKGVFDGNDYKIITSVPVFEKVSGTVENLTVEGNVSLSSLTENAGTVAKLANNAKFENITNHADVSGKSSAGGVVGKATGNCTFINIINTGAISGNQAAGIVGTAENTTTEQFIVSNCTNSGDITATGNAGGIVSYLDSTAGYTIEDCVNEGNVESPSNAVGGIVAVSMQPKGLIKNCTNRGNIKSPLQTGGILGYSQYSLIFENCLNDTTATISGNGKDNYSGGIAARIGIDNLTNEVCLFKNCINKGTVITTKDNCGGILALTRVSAYFDTCFNYGSVEGNRVTGGISGSIDYYADFINCINYGSVISRNDKAGGISGVVGTSKSYSYSYRYESCGNEGDVQGKYYSSGIAAYLFGEGNKSASFQYCYNIGNVTSTYSYVTGILGLIDGVSDPIIQYNYIGGTFTPSSGEYSFATAYISSDTLSDGANQHNNYVLKGVVDYLRFKGDLGGVTIPSNYAHLYSSSDLLLGGLTHKINTEVGKDVFYQTLDVDTYPTTNKSHHAVRFNGSYRNILKATFVNGNDIVYIDADTGESFTAPEGEEVLYWNCGGSNVIPTSACQITTDKTFQGKKLSIQTDNSASVRIAEGATGLRFYTYIDKSSYDSTVTELAGTSYKISQGTVITPYSFIDEADEFSMEALDELTKSSIKYLNISYSGTFAEYDDAYIVTGSIVNLAASPGKRDNRTLDFAAIGYVCITDIISNTSYYLYSNTYSTRNVSSVASSALDDVRDNIEIGYSYVVEGGTNNAKYSPYTAKQRAILEDLIVTD